jgi:tetratricopeptide (TPR) repeat protein
LRSTEACLAALRYHLEPQSQLKGGQLTPPDAEQAILDCEDAARVAEEAGDDVTLSQVHTSLGILYWEAGELRQSLGSYKKRLEAVERLGDRLEISRVSGNLGMLHLFTGNTEDAATYLAQAFVLASLTPGAESQALRAGEQLLNAFGASVDAANTYLRAEYGPLAPQVRQRGSFSGTVA